MSCMSSVEPPFKEPPFKLLTKAPAIRMGSIPRVLKKRWSSIEVTALTNITGILSVLTRFLCSAPKVATTFSLES